MRNLPNKEELEHVFVSTHTHVDSHSISNALFSPKTEQRHPTTDRGMDGVGATKGPGSMTAKGLSRQAEEETRTPAAEIGVPGVAEPLVWRRLTLPLLPVRRGFQNTTWETRSLQVRSRGEVSPN